MAAAPPPAPRNILRDHRAQVHAAAFVRDNERLVTADAEGHIVVWDLAVMRAVAVWRAHEKPILAVRGWGRDKVITHGRDHKLIVWRLAEQDEALLDAVLPVEHVAQPRRQPWILHLLEVNTLNFCAFAACAAASSCALDSSPDILIAVPNALASEAIDVFALPSQSRVHTIKSSITSGLVMGLHLLHHAGSLTLVAGFEDGCASVQRLNNLGAWITTYRSRAHSQPILSLDLDPAHEFFLTSSADSMLAKHPIPTAQQSLGRAETGSSEASGAKPIVSNASSTEPVSDTSRLTERLQEWKHPLKAINTKHSGQQSLRVRSDGRIFATGGWDSNIRVYSCKTMKELAVLQWHKAGVYAVAFADVVQASSTAASGQAAAAPLAWDSSGAQVAAPARCRPGLDVGVSVKERRTLQARTAHWIVAGAKDGKVSLWELY